MSFKYINAGNGKLISSVFSVKTDKTYNPYNSNQSFTGNGTMTLDAPTKKLYVKAGFALTGTLARGLKLVAQNQSSSKRTGISLYNPFCPIINGNNGSNFNAEYSTQKYYEFLIEIVSDATNGVLKIIFDSKLIFSYEGNVMDGDDITSLYFSLSYNDCIYLSNLIVSDEPIRIAEKIISLPIASTTATMADNGDGSYTATEVGQSVMQTIDTAALEQEIGKGNVITGIQLVGNPAYFEGDGLTTVQAMRGDVVKAEKALEVDTDGTVTAGWAESIGQDYIGNLQLGWKAAE